MPMRAQYRWRDVAQASAAAPDSVDLAYCRLLLQKHWRLRCKRSFSPIWRGRTVDLHQKVPRCGWHSQAREVS